MARQIHIPTKEEIERDKPIVLKLFQAGIPMRRMQADYGFTTGYAKRLREELIADGSITREEIQAAHDRYMAEHPAAQGLDKHKARQKSNTEKADARHARSVAKKEKTFELVKQKKSISEIARELQVSETAITYYIKQLIEEGRLVKEEIVKASHGTVSVQVDKTSPEYIAQRDEFIKYLKMGWKLFAIRKALNITVFYSNIYMRDIKASGLMTSEEIEQAKTQKRQADLAELEEHLKSGYSIDAFRELHPEFAYNDVTPLVNELVEQGKITREQLDQNRKKNAVKTLNRDVAMSPEEQLDFIIKKVKKGYSPQEIVASDKTKSLTMYKVLFQKRQIIAKGIISQEEADEAMAKRQGKKLTRKHGKAIDRVRELTIQGYNMQEIAEKIGYGYGYLCALKNKEAKGNGWYTNEELKEFKRQRQIREYEALPQEEKDRIKEEKRKEALRIETEKEQRQAEVLAKRQARKDKTQAAHQEKLEQIKKYVLKGKSVAEIANLIGVSKEHVYALQYESKRNGTWLTEKEEQSVQKKRVQKRNQATQKRHEKKAKEKEAERAQRVAQEERRKLEEIWRLRELAEQGFNNEEMAEAMHYSIAKISTLKRAAVQQGMWYSEDDIEFYKEQRIKREAEAEAKRQKEEQERIERERKEAERAIKEEQEALKRLEIEKRRKIQSYSGEYKATRKSAKREDKLEMNGEENVPTTGRKKFVGVLMKLYTAGATISENDIELITNAIYVHIDFADKNSLKLLIANAARSGGLVEAERMATELGVTLSETKYSKPLYQYKKWIQQQRMVAQIKQLKAQGWDNTRIAKELNISSAEVVVFLDNEGKKVDFFGEDGNR